MPAPADSFFFQFIDRHDGIDQSPIERRCRIILTAEQPDFLGPLHADGARHQPGTKAGIKAANAWSGLAETGILCGNTQIADQMQDMAAADGKAGDHCYHWLGAAPYLHLQIKHIEMRCAAFVDIAFVAAHLLVAARTKGFVAGTS